MSNQKCLNEFMQNETNPLIVDNMVSVIRKQPLDYNKSIIIRDIYKKILTLCGNSEVAAILAIFNLGKSIGVHSERQRRILKHS
jgi:hypothetical protein